MFNSCRNAKKKNIWIYHIIQYIYNSPIRNTQPHTHTHNFRQQMIMMILHSSLYIANIKINYTYFRCAAVYTLYSLLTEWRAASWNMRAFIRTHETLPPCNTHIHHFYRLHFQRVSTDIMCAGMSYNKFYLHIPTSFSTSYSHLVY